MHTPQGTTFIDRAFAIVTICLALLLAVVFIAAGIALSLAQNPKLGQLGNAFAADLFLTLGVTSSVGTLAWCFPRIVIFRVIADHMFRNLCVLGVALGVLFFVLLIFVI